MKLPRPPRSVLVWCSLFALVSTAVWLVMFRHAEIARPAPSRAAPVRSNPSLAVESTFPGTRHPGTLRKKRREDREDPDEDKDLDEDIVARFRKDQPRSSLKEIQASLANVAPASPLLWTSLGPVNPHVQIGGQYTGMSGKLQAFAWEPTHPQVMYAGGGLGSSNEGPATQAGVFKTTDGGNTWAPINNGLQDPMVDVLWIDQSNPNVLLAGTEFAGLFRTADAGQSWTQVSTDAPVSAIVTTGGAVLAGTGVGFELSNDDGVTWTVLQNTPSPVRCIAVNGSVSIGGLDQGGVLFKGPSDQAWQTVIAPNSQFTVWDVAIDPVDPTVAYYIRGYGGPPDNLVFRTKDGGTSWQVINAPTSTNGFSQALAVLPDRSILVAGQSMFYRSQDFGVTWTTLNAPWDSRRIFQLPGTSSLVMGSDHGLHWTDNLGTTWLDLTKSISSNILFSVDVNGQTILTSSQDFGPFLSTDGGNTWSEPAGPLAEGGGVAINPGNPGYCYALTNSGFVVSSDHCQTFTSVAGPTSQDWVSAANQNRIAVNPQNSTVIYVGDYNGVWSSTDSGLTLTKLSWPMQQVTQIVLDPNDPQAIYVCASSGFYQSLNGGASWTQLALPTSSSPYVAAVSPSDSNVILVALSDGAGRSQGGILRSTDRGLTFTFANQGLSTTLFNLGNDQQSIAFNPSPPAGTNPVVALATTGGIYASGDLGITWQDIRSNATPRVFSFVHWDQGYLWATTYGQGVIKSDRPVTSDLLKSTLSVVGGPVSFFNTQGSPPSTGSQTLQVTTDGASQSFTAVVSQGNGANCGSWLSASPATGITIGTATGTPVTVSYSAAGFPPNTSTACSGSITVAAATAGGSPVTVPVTLLVTQQATIQASVSALSFTDVQGDASPNSQILTITGAANFPYTVLAASSPAEWLTVSPSSGTANGPSITVAESAAALLPGEYSGSITVTSAQAQNSPLVIPVSLAISATPSYLITTVAGGEPPATAAPATSVTVPVSYAAVDASGNVFFSSSNLSTVFKVDTSGVLTSLAGNGTSGFSGDGGPALSAQLSFPNGIAVDAHGNLYIADSNNQRIRMVASNGIITTVAGTGSAGYSGDDGPAAGAQLNYPNSVTVDGSGNLYITDSNNIRIRKVASNGTITTVAGNGTSGYSGDNGSAVSAQLNNPWGTGVDSSGNLYIADTGNNRVRKVSTGGVITTVAGNGSCCDSGDNGPAISAQMNGPVSVALDSTGILYIAAEYDNNVRRVGANGIITTAAGNGQPGFSGDGGSATASQLNNPRSVAVDPSGNLYIGDDNNGRVRKISLAGNINTVAGGGTGDRGQGVFAGLVWPTKIAVDKQGNIYVSDTYGHRVRKIAPNGAISTVAGTGTSGYSGDNGPATAAQLNNPQGVAIDSSGNLYISDSNNQRIRMVNQNGTIVTVAGNGLCCYSGDNGPATAAQLNSPNGIGFDASGNLYVADTGGQRIRKVDTKGIITTVAGNGTSGFSGDNGPATSARLFEPWDVAIDSSGNLYIGDAANNRVRKVSPAGVITTFAGTGGGPLGDNGPATSAALTDPRGVAMDPAGNLYIAGGDNRVRKILPNGTILTIAGSGFYDYSGDGGPASSAALRRPVGLALDSSGNVYVGDASNGAVRRLTVTGTQPVLTITSQHSAGFVAGQSSTYTLSVSNAGSAAPTTGTITVTENMPSGLTLTGMSGSGWTCSGSSCTRSDSLSVESSYPPITTTVNVGTGLPPQVTNQVSVSGGGAGTTGASDLTLTGATPVISNVQDAESARTSVVPGEWAAIYGTNLAASSRTWAAGDFTNGNALPTSIDGVSVQFGGVAAAVYYISPTQLDVQVPDGISGSVPVTVTLNRAQSASFTTTVLPIAPSLFVYQGGSVLYAAATHADGSLIGDPAVTAGTTKASPGETIVLYVNGLDSSPSGTIISMPVPYGNPVAVTVGSMNAPVTFAGLVAAGEYQVNAMLPAGLTAGNDSITVRVGGQVSPANVILPVQ